MEGHAGGAFRGGRGAGDRLAAARVFRWRDGLYGVAVEIHRLGFEAAGVMAGAAFCVGDSGRVGEPRGHGIAPHYRLAGLIFQLREHVAVALLVDAASQGLPLLRVPRDRIGAFVMRIVDVLDHRFAGMQAVRIRDVVHEKQQIVRAGFERFVDPGHLRPVLADEAGAGGDGAVHAGAFGIGAVPLSPAVALGGLDVHAIVVAGDVGEGLETERTGVVFVGAPGAEENAADGRGGFAIRAEGEARPLVRDFLRAQVGVPREAAESVEIGLHEVVAGPVLVEPDVCDTGESADARLHGAGANIEIEHLFPHRREIHRVLRLPEIFRCDLQLDGFASMIDAAEERRCRFAHLEIDRAVLDLDDDVGVELAVERLEIVVGGAGAVVLQIAPVHVVVVDEAAVEEQAAVRREGARDHVGGVGVRAAVGGRPDAAFGIGFQDDAG